MLRLFQNQNNNNSVTTNSAMEEDTSQRKEPPLKAAVSRKSLAVSLDDDMSKDRANENKNSVEVDSLLSVDEIDALPKNLKYGTFDLFCTLVSIVTYVADLAMDIVVAVYFYHLGVNHGIYHYWYFGLTVTFILLPSLTMTGFSFRWYLQDVDDSQLPAVPLWRWVLRLIVLMLQIAPVLR